MPASASPVSSSPPGSPRLPGTVGVVPQATGRGLNGVGMAEVGSEHWRAVTEEGRLLPVDTHVTVIRVEGTRVVVRAVA